MKLIPNQIYTIQYSGEFCHATSIIGKDESPLNADNGYKIKATFIGTISIKYGNRNIFYSEDKTFYFMFTAENTENYIVDFYLQKEKSELLQRLSEIETLLLNEIVEDNNKKL